MKSTLMRLSFLTKKGKNKKRRKIDQTGTQASTNGPKSLRRAVIESEA